MANKVITAKLSPIGSAAPDHFAFSAEVYSPMMISLDQIEGWTPFRVAGVNPDIDTGTVPEGIWYGGGTYPWKPAAGPLEVLSSSATDIGAVVRLGLLTSAHYLRWVDVTIGAGPVLVSGGSYLRINSAYVVTPTGANPSNVGTVTIRDSGGGTARGMIPPGEGQLSSTAYTVPANRVLAVWAGVAGFVGAETGNRAADLRLVARPFGGAELYGTAFGVPQGNTPYTLVLPMPVVFQGKTDIVLRCTAVSASNLQVSGALYGVEVHVGALSELVPLPGALIGD